MPNTNADYICPLYQRRNRGTMIRCEGILPGSAYTLTRFPTVSGYVRWNEKYCKSWAYRKCPIYKAVEERYEKNDG